MRNLILLGMLLLLGTSSISYAQDFKGSKDHPLISRYQGSTIKSYAQNNYESYTLILEYYAEKREVVEGEFTSIVYHAPAGRSQLEVHRNYQKALTQQGFTPLFDCTKCGTHRFTPYLNFNYLPSEHYSEVGVFDSGNYSVYKKGGTYVVLNSATNYDNIAVTAVDIIYNKEMDEGMVKVNADLIAKSLKEKGKIAIYGIHFDTGKSTIKPDSEPTLNEIVKYLKANPTVNLFVVGHTDMLGTLANNMSLSEARAAAVVKALSQKGIASSRLTPKGVGPLAPVANNATDQGKAKNRRVEFVLR